MPSFQLDEKYLNYLLAVALVSTALLAPALQIYLGNVDQFSTSLVPTLRLTGLFAVVCLLTLLVFLKYCSARSRTVVGLTLAVLSILFWIQSSFLVWDYGVLDGSAIDWTEKRSYALIDTTTWIAVIALSVALIRFKKSKLVVQAALILWAVQLIPIMFNIVDKQSSLSDKPNTYSDDAMQNIASFSKNKNVLHIVLDAFQADVFEQLIAAQDNSRYYNESFKGFTYYRETMGIFPRTKYSVPAFLAGKVYDNATESGYIESVMKGKTILSVAEQNQFKIDIVADGAYQIGQYKDLPHDNILDLNDLPALGRESSEAALLLDLTLFRILPGFLKPKIYNDQKWTISRIVRGDSEHLNFEYFTNAIFLNVFIDTMTANREAPTYKYIHLFSTHGAKVVNKDCRYAGAAYPHKRRTYTYMAKCTLDSMAQLINKMKTLGIYDNTLILIHADHGGWVWNLRRPMDDSDIGFQLPSDSKPRLLPVTIRAAASPLLAIKTPNATGHISTSNKQATLMDIPDTVSDIMGWNEGFKHRSLIQLPEDEQRKRYFRYYDREKDSEKNDYTGPIAQYRIEGSHYEANWKLELVLLPRNEKK